MNSLAELAAVLLIGMLVGGAIGQVLSGSSKPTVIYMAVPAVAEQESKGTGCLGMVVMGLVAAGLLAVVVAFG